LLTIQNVISELRSLSLFVEEDGWYWAGLHHVHEKLLTVL
jgi:hypothetical protein